MRFASTWTLVLLRKLAKDVLRKGGSGLTSIGDCVDATIQRLKEYIKAKRLITTAITGKQKCKGKYQ